MQFKCCLKNGPALEYRVLRYKIAIQASIQMLFKNGLGRGRGGKKSAETCKLLLEALAVLLFSDVFMWQCPIDSGFSVVW